MTSLRKALGAVVRRRREELGFSQESFAQEAKIHRTYMTGIERGQHNPSLDVLERLSLALNIELSAMLREAESERKRPRKTP